MAKKEAQKKQALPPLDFSRRNWVLFAVGLGVLVVGYRLLSVGPWDNPISRTVAPLVLLAAYLVVFPLAILIGGRRKG